MDHEYNVFKQRCVSHNDLRNMLSEDGPTRANLLCMLDCVQHGFHKTDTRRSPARVAPGAGIATHDNVVTEVMNRIGPAIEDSIARAIGAGMGALTPPAEPAPDANPLPGGNGGGGNGGDAVMEPERAEAPPVPVGYGQPTVHQPSEVHGAADEVDAATFKGLPLSENVTAIEPEAQPKPLTVDELEALRAKLKE